MAPASHYKTASKLHLRELFADDPQSGERLAVGAVGFYLKGSILGLGSKLSQ
jgi:hypothetical protein